MKISLNKKKLALAVSFAVGAQLPVSAFSQDNDQMLEEMVVTGSRSAPRSVFDSAVPIDVIGGDDFENQGDTDLSNLLRNVVPSYNVNTQPISDAATIVRPVNMRGLAPDHTLVLVNNKRRHRASVIYWLGNGVSDGAQGPDISPIPAIALQQVEVLRDGAAAQYGSDAIAGVINFILKEDSEGGSVQFKTGQFYEGDGLQNTISANVGLPAGDNGFVNLSVEYGNTDPTDRSVQRDDAQALIDAGNTAVATPAQVWGQPEIKGEFKFFGNFGADLAGDLELYAFSNYMQKEVEGGFYFRNPDTRSAVFAREEGIRLVGDLTPDMSGNCPTDLRIDDAAGLQAVIADENCFVFNEMFPGGFTPRFGGEVTDFAFTTGVRKRVDGEWNYDISIATGSNESDFFIRNTVNASMGPDSPTEFDPGAYKQIDTNFNADIYRDFDFASSFDLTTAFGVEWREEEFEITRGDEASFLIGPLADQGFSAASNGFPGFSDLAAGSWARSNVAIYADVEMRFFDRWLLGNALRWEEFEDFGSTVNGKISTNFEVSETISLRGSISTGFRAPTPGQSNAFNVSTEFDQELGDLVNNGTIPSTNPVAALRGGEELEPEKSENLTAGIIFQLGNVDLTVDYFRIKLKDRIAVSQLFSLTDEEVEDLLASGVTSAANLQNFRFFTNDFDTTTEGVDLVATWGTSLGSGNLDLSLAFNITETTVDDFSPDVIDETRIRELEEGLPSNRWTLSSTYTSGDWRFTSRLNYFGDFYDSEDDQTYGDELMVDIEGAYTFAEQFTLIAGAQNVLDEYPDENPNAAANTGNLYSQFAPGGFGGGFYYMRVSYDF